MNEREKLFALRGKLVTKRRAIVESFLSTPIQNLTGESIARIQAAIDAIDRAVSDEKRAAEPGIEGRTDRSIEGSNHVE